MSLVERLESTNISSSDHHDIVYLKSSELGRIVNRGLVELYKIQPKNPVTFLANWLLNESRSNEIKKKMDEGKRLKEELKHHYEAEKKIAEEKRRHDEKIRILEEDKKIDFLNRIKNSVEIEDNMNIFCDELKRLVNATGVYVMTYDRKRKFPVSEEEDETAHLMDEKVLRYIFFCEDHQSILKNKYLEPNTGATYDLMLPKDDEKPQDEVENNDNKENSETLNAKEPELNYKEIKEVVGSDEGLRIKFFKEPRLGSYLAIDMSYKASLHHQSLLSAIENKKEYDKNLALLDEKRKEYEMIMAQKEKEKPEHDSSNVHINSNEENFNQSENAEFQEENVELQEYYKEERKLIFALDTLGQDRTFSENEKQYILQLVKMLKNKWEKLEETLLYKCRDVKIAIDDLDKQLKDSITQEKIEMEEEKLIKEYFESENNHPTLDERAKAIESDYYRSKLIISQFFDNQHIKNAFLMYSKLELVEHERLFQNTLNFIGVSNTDINEENTNKLDWKKAKKLWNETVLEKLRDYNPIGPKAGVLPYYRSGNRLLLSLETINREELRSSSFVLSRLLDFLLLILRVRRDDILRRRDHTNDLIETRRLAMEHKNEIADMRERALDEARRQNEMVEEGVEVEPFNEDEFLNRFDQEHPDVKIPEEVFYDIDDDMDVDKLAM